VRRALVAVVGVLAVVVAMAAAAVAGTVGGRHEDVPGYQMHGMTSAPPDRGGTGWMNGSAVDSEFAYLTEMVAHHEEAVAAAQELQRSNRPQMRTFGASIVTTQSAQIDQMNAWLARWYPGRSTDVDYQPMMRDLSRLSGDELDQAFLEDMIGHHMVAVMMSQQLLVSGLADHAAVSSLAESIRDEQHAEIIQMQRWLADWFDTGWRHGPGSGTRPRMTG
jgi:uncharacterized protein (DUF305 family)